MRYIKVFVSSTKAHELMSIINGVTRKMMIPVRMFDTGCGMEGRGQMWIKFEVIFIQILKQIFSAKYFSDLYQLVVIIVTVKERFLPEQTRWREGRGLPG